MSNTPLVPASTIAQLPQAATLDGTEQIPMSQHGVTVQTLISALSSFLNGVQSLNGATGALNLVAGTNITISVNGKNITIGSSGGVSTQTISGAAGTLTLTSNTTYLFVDTSGGVASFALPAASTKGRTVIMIDFTGNSGSNPISTTVAGGGNINGSSATVTTSAAWTIITFIDNGTSWNM